MNIDIKALGGYPEGSTSYPSGCSQGMEAATKAATKAASEAGFKDDEARQMALDMVNNDHFEEVKKAYAIISHDVNGNSGRALARLFADEHPEIQQMFYEALNAGMLLRHQELLRVRDEEPWSGSVGYTDRLDGRVRINTATFVVGGKDVTWK